VIRAMLEAALGGGKPIAADKVAKIVRERAAPLLLTSTVVRARKPRRR
jgi:hypothetical protein